MASSFQNSINRASVVGDSDDITDIEQENNEILLEKKDEVQEDDDQIKSCKMIRKFLRAISLG